MVLFIHIVTALSGLVFATMTAFVPTRSKLKISYGLIVGTLASGSLLIVINNASILRTCVSGLLYTAATYGLTALGRYKLAAEEAENK